MPEVDPISSELTMPQYGSYRVLHPLGSGGMSSVYRAVHVETGHEVALKVLPAHLARNPIVLQRFMREARSAESLQHPSIVAIYDRGVDRGRHYLVLEYVEGIDLHGYVQTRGPLGSAEAVRVIREVAEGLSYAAQRGLVHRDIKPSNILRSVNGEIKITDLGLALQWEFEDERVTREGTTVGTVDYMAPEQARDSRAAGPVSDQYSLGCTLYYLLTGIPPFPGGDITDKLTRHAQSPPPEVRDLRPDVPEALSRIMRRMMAKRPEDRYPSFDELIQALDRVPVEFDGGSAIALVPLAGESPGGLGAGPAPARAFSSEPRPPSSIPEISLASLPPELIEPEPVGAGRAGAGSPAGSPVFLSRTAGPGLAGPVPLGRTHSRLSTAGWIGLCVGLAVGFVLSVVIIDRLVRSPAPAESSISLEPEPAAKNEEPSPEPVPAHEVEKGPSEPAAQVASQEPAKPPPPAPAPPPRPTISQAPAWVEPEDPETPDIVRERDSEETLRRYLPPWALAPIPRGAAGPLVVARRVPGAGEASLRAALDETKGTVEIADEGPFLLNDLRIPGESRVVRARDGFRSILRIERPSLQVVRALPGVFVLDGKNLVLDSLDLILNVRDLPAGQDCLFYCTGSSLTVRNCTITLVNPGNVPFALVRTGTPDARGCRVRFEHTLVRGSLTTAFDLGSGSSDLVLRDSIVIGSQGPLVRSSRTGQGADHRFSVLGSITACRGPAIDLVEPVGTDSVRPRPLVVRAYHSVFGRFQGAGIASVTVAVGRGGAPRDRVDWLGDRNLFCGWRGFYATGKEPTLVLTTLDAHRSTWNGSDGSSQAIPVAWPQPTYLGQAEARDWLPFVPGWEAIVGRVAQARPFLGAKTLWSFPPPVVPLPLVLGQPGQASGGPLSVALLPSKELRLGHPVGPGGTPAGPQWRPTTGDVPELVFDAEATEWHGDLGAFLRATLGEGMRRARVRVHGAGPRRFSPVRLPDGLSLEILVAAPTSAGAEWLSWSPDPESSGRALIELRRGTLILSQLRLRDDPRASIESLLHVEDGDLVLHRCQLTGSGGEDRTRRLITFRAPTTRPRTTPPVGLFATPPDRPVCLIGDSTLIAPGVGVRAEVGRGVVGLFQTALEAAGNALELVPTRVARSRFDADLVLDHVTLASETSIVRVEPWPGREPGPDRPWLIQSQHCAYLGTYDRRMSDTVLLRAEGEALPRGLVFWQGLGDAVDVDRFAAVDGEPPTGRNRDVVLQWVNLWGSEHQREIIGPRAGSNLPSVRLLERLRAGRVEPADLMLDPGYHPWRPMVDVGADLARQGIYPRHSPAGRRR